MRNLKTISFSLLALLIASVIYPHAASAVTANSRCSKSGATATIKGQSYVCAQNPTVKTKRLTWTLKDCLAANTAYLTSLKSFNETEASSQKVLETIDASIKGLEAQVPIDKERAAKEQESATQNRTMAATRQKEADERYAKAKAAGVTAVTPAWAIQANAASNDGKITATELTNLAKTWAITPEQAAQVFNFLAAEKIAKAAESYTKAAERNEKNAAEFLKTEQRAKDLAAQKSTTLEAQEALISIAKGDVSTTLKVRNAVCAVKK